MLAVTALGAVMVSVDALAVSTVLPPMARDLSAPVADLHWVVTAYTLAIAVSLVPASALGDLWGRRRAFGLGLMIFTLGSAACAAAGGLVALVVARVVQGVGAAAVLSLGLTLLTASASPSSRGRLLGAWGGINGVAVAAGPVLGGLLTERWGWQAIFALNLPLGALALALVPRVLTRTPPRRRAVDAPGTALTAGTAVTLVAGIARIGSDGWADPLTVSLLASAVVLAWALWRWERVAPAPLLPMTLLRAPGFAPGVGAALLLSLTATGATFLLASQLQLTQGLSPAGAGLALLPWTLTPIVATPLAGLVADRVGPAPVLAAGMAAQAGGLLWYAADPAVGATSVAALLLSGVGISAAMPTVAHLALGDVEASSLATASGLLATGQRIGAACGVALAGSVLAAYSGADLSATYAAGFTPALATVAALSACGAVLSWRARPAVPARVLAGAPAAGESVG